MQYVNTCDHALNPSFLCTFFFCILLNFDAFLVISAYGNPTQYDDNYSPHVSAYLNPTHELEYN